MHKNFPQHFLGASLQEQPDKFYMALSRKRRIVEAESSMQTIMANLQSYRIKFALNCEVCIILRAANYCSYWGWYTYITLSKSCLHKYSLKYLYDIGVSVSTWWLPDASRQSCSDKFWELERNSYRGMQILLEIYSQLSFLCG